MKEKLHTLIHLPRGNEHPYKRKAFERSPRDPIAGENVIIGAVTQPSGAAERVWIDWRCNDGARQQLEAKITDQNEKETIWQALLPAFDAGQKVSYCLVAIQDGVELQTQEYHFSVPGWERSGQVNMVYGQEDALIITFQSEGELAPALIIAQPQPTRLHFEWSAASSVSPAFSTQDPCQWQITKESERRIQADDRDVRLIIEREPFSLCVCHLDGTQVLKQSEPPYWLVDGKQSSQLHLQFDSPPDEAFYGFGERFNQLNQRGQTLDVRVYEAYKNQGKFTYIPMPLHISSLGYGLFINTNRYVTYDLAATEPDAWSFTAELNDSRLAYDLVIDEHPWHIVGHLTQLTAVPKLPPAWVFGPWMSGNDWNSQARVTEEVQKTIELGIPATVMVIEAWSDEATFYIWNDALYEPHSDSRPYRLNDFTFPSDGLWPDPLGMIEDLHEAGLRLILWQIPALKNPDWTHEQSAFDRTYMIKKGYCVHEADGSPYKIRPYWFHEDLLLDVTNQRALDWWLNKRAYLLDEMGVDGFKTDGGEHMWGRDLQFADGRIGAELWNLYPNLYVGAYYNFANEKRNGEAITFSRAGYTGAQAFPCHWAGDENSTWDAFRASILAGLNAGISGIPFWGWDIGGFSGEIPSAELYLRSTAMATFCPIMQYHSEYNARRSPSRDRTPWNIQERTGDEDVIPVFRRYANLRMNLLPYILSEAHYASQNGVPMMRALSLEYPHDYHCADYPYQYLFGRALLVAPVVEQGADTWDVYLPHGHWSDFWTGEAHQGPQRLTVRAPKDHLPVYVREGTILPLNLDHTLELGRPVGNAVDRYEQLCFKLYAAGTVTVDWFDALAGKSITWHISQKADPNQMLITGDTLPYPAKLIAPDGTILEIGAHQ